MNTPKNRFLIFFIAIVFVLSACGPTPEEIATQTAAAWTPTPVPTATPPPTPTPTPIPYDLTVSVQDTESNPIVGASISFPQSGDDEPVLADDSGQFAWTNLPGPEVSLVVSAQGYFQAEVDETLERGPGEMVVTMERDPLALLPENACGTGETLLLLEDFQDSEAKNWPEINFNADGWSLTEDNEDAANIVASIQRNEGSHPFANYQSEVVFDQAVWRFRMKTNGFNGSFNWRHSGGFEDDEGNFIDDSRYQITFFSFPNAAGAEIRRIQLPVVNIGATSTSLSLSINEWHTFEISTYEGLTQMWVDGVLRMQYADPFVLPPGTISFEVFDNTPTETITYFDDITVCELSAPFVPLPTAEAAEDS